MCRNRLGSFAVFFACVATTAVAAQKDVLPPGQARADDDSGEPLAVLAADPARAEIAAAGSTGSCRTIGTFQDTFSRRTPRFRGNAYHLNTDVTLVEVQMELDIPVSTTLHFAVYQKSDVTGEWNTLTGSLQVSALPGRNFYSSGLINLPLAGGFDYAMAFAWDLPSITYGRDILLDVTYPSATPASFDIGQILGRVGTNIAPPFPNTLNSNDMALSGVAAHSMLLCLEPVPGACCSPTLGVCSLKFENNCLAEAGANFFGERTLCLDHVCEFGLCCRSCGECESPATREACESPGDGSFRAITVCPIAADLSTICEPITGACCSTLGGTCSEVCEADCTGTYRGDGTTCDPDICKGACCVPDFGCDERTRSSCDNFQGSYVGDGTTCATLSPQQECGGACCFGNSALTSCSVVQNRAICKHDAFPQTAYRGDTTSCPTFSGTDDCGTIDSFSACCLIDGTDICINTTLDACPPAIGDFDPVTLCPQNGCPPPARACCLQDGSCQLLTRDACAASLGEWNRGIDVCDPGFCESGACCGTAPDDCLVSTQAACSFNAGIFAGAGTDCSAAATTCPGFGACCEGGIDCVNAVTLDECERVIGGSYLSDSSTCIADGVACDQRGACCAQTGTCLFITLGECDALPVPGVFNAVGTRCTPNFCPSGACCHDSGCTVTGETRCIGIDGLNGNYRGNGTECTAIACLPSGACCVNGTCVPDQTPGGCGNGDYLGNGSTCNNAPCSLGTCCDHGACTGFQIVSTCETGDPDIIFLLVGTSCSPDPCEPFGACCFTSGDCVDGKSQTDCQLEGGTLSRDLLCNQINCQPIGACCFNDGTCENAVSQSSCEFQGGTLSGQDLCADSVCPEIGACCPREGICEEDVTRADCEARRGTSTPDRTCGQIPLCIPVGACCMPAPGQGCVDDMTRQDCESIATGGTYRGDGENCPVDGSACGACCSLTGCLDSVMSSQCVPTDQEESFLAGFTCANRVSEFACKTRGACCLDDDVACKIRREPQCIGAGQRYAGDGVPCPAPGDDDLCFVGACCTVQDGCTQQRRLECERAGLSYRGAGLACIESTCVEIVSVAPENCSIDPAQPSEPDGIVAQGVQSLLLTFSLDMTGILSEHLVIEIQPGGVTAPGIIGIFTNLMEVTVDLDVPVPAGQWTCVVHVPSGMKACAGSLPGDVNLDSQARASDSEAQLSDLNALLDDLVAPALPLNQCDINRSGACTPLDILREMDLLLGAEAYSTLQGQTMLPVCPATP